MSSLLSHDERRATAASSPSHAAALSAATAAFAAFSTQSYTSQLVPSLSTILTWY
jgi:hypothetical protein